MESTRCMLNYRAAAKFVVGRSASYGLVHIATFLRDVVKRVPKRLFYALLSFVRMRTEGTGGSIRSD